MSSRVQISDEAAAAEPDPALGHTHKSPVRESSRRVDLARSADQPHDAHDAQDTLQSVLPTLRTTLGLVSGAVVIAALYFGREILMPLALAFLFGFALDPLVARLKRWGLPRMASVVLVMAVVIGVLAGAGLLLGKQVSMLSAELPTYQHNIRAKFRDLRASLSGPSMFDGAMRTLETVQREVARTAPAAAPSGSGRSGPPAQRVIVEQAAPTSFEQGMAWLERAGGPLATAGIVFVFIFLVLADRLDLRDRLLRLMGGNLHRSTDAMDEAGRRISKYLTMQLVVNMSYGLPMALGLWLIGVPGAMLWGAVAAVMRFVPYIGPMISAIFPLALAFAVDPGWNMVLYTLALIVVLELLSNNVVEPLLYGASTGLSAMSLIAAATFWTALWGPIGLIMSTPLTVCLLVIGRYIPQLQFLDVLLGTEPALDAPTRLYQRLLAGDVEESIELAEQQVQDLGLQPFYDRTGMAVLRLATEHHASNATVEHRHRLVSGMDALIEDLEEEHPGDAAQLASPASSFSTPREPAVICIGGKWEVDALAARMLAHALSAGATPAQTRPLTMLNADAIARLDLGSARTVCVSYFSPNPRAQARQFCRRLRRRFPHLQIVVGLWGVPVEQITPELAQDIGADALCASLDEAVQRVNQLLGEQSAAQEASVSESTQDEASRLQALHQSGLLDGRARESFAQAARRAADVFDVALAQLVLVDAEHVCVVGSSQPGDAEARERQGAVASRVVASGEPLVIPDVERDPRITERPSAGQAPLRACAAVPLRAGKDVRLGALCIWDHEIRSFDEAELRLMGEMAQDLMRLLADEGGIAIKAPTDAEPAPPVRSSAIVGQPIGG